MEVIHLDQSEIDIECSVRNIPGPSNLKHTLLAKALLSEREGELISPCKPHEDAIRRPRLEIVECVDKLNQIRNDLRTKLTDESGEDTLAATVLIKLRSKLIHVEGRLARLSTLTEATVDSKYLLEICAKLRNIFKNPRGSPEDLNKTIKSLDELDINIGNATVNPQINNNSPQTNLTPPPNPTLMHHSTPICSTNLYHDQQEPPVSTIHTLTQNFPLPMTSSQTTCAQAPYRDQFTNLRYDSFQPPKIYPNIPQDLMETYLPYSNRTSGATSPRVLLSKNVRNLRFDGSVHGLSVDRFVYRFESIAADYGISINRLVEEVHGFLDGPALEFYWQCRESNGNISWPAMRMMLRDRFQDFRSDPIIKSALESRKQKTGEPFVEYYNDLLNISSTLRQPISSHELITIVMKNMRTALQLELASWLPSSLPELVQRCTHAEYTWKRLGAIPEYQVTRRNINEIHHIKHTPRQNHDYQSFIYPDSLGNIDAINRTNRGEHDIGLKCWNCGGLHKFPECEVPIKGVFCFGCGRRDVLKPYCPVCRSKLSGNRKEGMRPLGNTHALSQVTSVPRPELIEAASNTDPELKRMILKK